MKIHIDISRKVKPAIPLTPLGERIMLFRLKVVNIPSPNKISANIKIRNPNIASSVLMKISHLPSTVVLGLGLKFNHTQPQPKT